MELADRTSRLLAAIIDRALYLPFVLTAAILFPGVLRGGESAWLAVTFAVVIPLIIFAYQCWLLATAGQTIGKRYMKLRIVKVPDLSQGGFVTNVLMRQVAMWAIGAVPVLGSVVLLVNPFFIFRDDRRCIHDHIAGTCVIKA